MSGITPVFTSQCVSLFAGDALTVTRQLSEKSVNTVVTSPPYYGLRDYETASWDGGDDTCDHIASVPFVNPKNTLGPKGYLPESNAANKMHTRYYRNKCGKCGAKRVDDQLGNESSFEEYIEKLVLFFRAVSRVLRDDGTVWLNLGDSYYNYRPGSSSDNVLHALGGKRDKDRHLPDYSNKRKNKLNGVKEKDLIGIPWRVALALQADGWYLRSDIIWAKANPLPESVQDRPTKSHEYIFLLSKNKDYYYDSDAIKEPYTTVGKNDQDERMRNKRSVWNVNTQPYPGAHFAVFPPSLITPCILAGAPEGGMVLDPFIGSGTTAYVAQKYGRNCIGIDLSEKYLREHCVPRLSQQSLFMAGD